MPILYKSRSRFFEQPRKNFGHILLVIACVLMVAWVRSEMYEDTVLIPEKSYRFTVPGDDLLLESQNTRILVFVSQSGLVRWSIISGDRRIPRARLFFVNWETHSILQSDSEVLESTAVHGPYVIPHWCFVLLFAVLSAYLLYRRRRLQIPDRNSDNRQDVDSPPIR